MPHLLKFFPAGAVIFAFFVLNGEKEIEIKI